jgi:hypothetical protein
VPITVNVDAERVAFLQDKRILVTKMVNLMVRQPHAQASSAAYSALSRERHAADVKRSMHPVGGHVQTFHHERRGPLNQQYSSTSQRQIDDLVCDYDHNVTPLYELLESSQWDQARLKSRIHPEQVQTWIVRRDEQQQIKWKLLPLHAAVIFQAPIIVVEALFQEYPDAVAQRDDQGMLPLHLAFRHSMDDAVLEFLLLQYSKAVSVQDRRGRIPLDHAGERTFSAALLNAYTQACLDGRSVEAPAPETNSIRAQYETMITSLQQEHEQNLLLLQQRMEEEQEAMRVHHELKVKELQGQASKREVNSVGAYHHLQDALERVSADNQALRTRLQEQKNLYEELQAQMKLILQDQMTLQKYCEQQQKELVKEQQLREGVLRSLSVQKETGSSVREISKLSESIRLRAEALLLRPEVAASPKVSRNLSPPRARAQGTGLRYTRQDHEWRGPVPKADNGDDGDDVSAITDDNHYQY